MWAAVYHLVAVQSSTPRDLRYYLLGPVTDVDGDDTHVDPKGQQSRALSLGVTSVILSFKDGRPPLTDLGFTATAVVGLVRDRLRVSRHSVRS